MYPIQKFDDQYTEKLISFLRCCLPESGRKLDLDQKHKSYLDVQHCFDAFWIMLDGEEIIGTIRLPGDVPRYVINQRKSAYPV